MPSRFGEGRREEDGVQVVEDRVAGGVEGVAESCGRVADGCDEERGGERHWEEQEKREGKELSAFWFSEFSSRCVADP